MPPRRGTRRGRVTNRGGNRGSGRGRNERAHDEVSQRGENPGSRNERREEEVEQPGPQNPHGQFAAELLAALAAQNLLRVPPTGLEARDAMREFRRMNPPMFDGDTSDPLRPNHWLADIRKLFTALAINDDSTRVNLVACQLTGEANEWWSSVLSTRSDTRRMDRAARGVDEPDVEKLTWAEFERIFEAQYFPESLKESFRDQFENLKKAGMSISEYSMKFQQLSRFAPEWVNTEERKCERFRKGLDEPIKSLLIASRCKTFAEMVETARALEIPGEASSGARREEARPTSTAVSAPSGFFGGQGRKRSREYFQPSHNQSGFRAPTSSGFRGGTVRRVPQLQATGPHACTLSFPLGVSIPRFFISGCLFHVWKIGASC